MPRFLERSAKRRDQELWGYGWHWSTHPPQCCQRSTEPDKARARAPDGLSPIVASCSAQSTPFAHLTRHAARDDHGEDRVKAALSPFDFAQGRLR